MLPACDDAPGSSSGLPRRGRLTRYRVPGRLNPDEKFEHWRTWYGSAVDLPMRLEKTDNVVRRSFNPTAVSLSGSGFSLVELTNEPVAGYWDGDTPSEEIRLVHFRTACAGFTFSGRSEAVVPGAVRFIDLSSSGSFHAPAGLGAVQINIDRGLLGLDEKSVQRLQALTDIRSNPVVRSLIVPVLSGWQHPDMDQEVDRLQPVVRSVMAALIGSLFDTHTDDADLRTARILTIRKFMRKNARNPALDVDAVVEYSHLSRRALYYLFEDEKLQVNGYIRALRALEALELLSAPNPRKTSHTAIAEASGFRSAAAMRRAVERATGASLAEIQSDPEGLRSATLVLRKSIGF
ncbi:helix-turn-helix domain-containing protein [Arthrobacter sp.]|uniref:helix-turn-helix domain-containing protein n=1 Tax=Arthrobacter sp. TaxID=1667 RepID=UPI0028982A3E|nr:helix-turn-helix domain-containing protein [Arthrobacter sp.]